MTNQSDKEKTVMGPKRCKVTDVIFTIRLGFREDRESKKFLSKLAKWLNSAFLQPSFEDYATEFVGKVLEAITLPVEWVTCEIGHSATLNHFAVLEHPHVGKGRKWYLDDIRLKNNSKVRLKMENIWLKGRIKVDGQTCVVLIEPENLRIPLDETLFLRW